MGFNVTLLALDNLSSLLWQQGGSRQEVRFRRPGRPAERSQEPELTQPSAHSRSSPAYINLSWKLSTNQPSPVPPSMLTQHLYSLVI